MRRSDDNNSVYAMTTSHGPIQRPVPVLIPSPSLIYRVCAIYYYLFLVRLFSKDYYAREEIAHLSENQHFILPRFVFMGPENMDFSSLMGPENMEFFLMGPENMELPGPYGSQKYGFFRYPGR